MTKLIVHKINSADIYILGWLLTYIATSISPSKFGGVLLLLLGVWSACMFAYVLLTEKHPIPPLRCLNLLMILLLLYGMVHLMRGEILIVYATSTEIPPHNYIKTLLSSCIPIYAFYYFTQKGLLTLQRIRFWSIISCFVAILQYLCIKHNLFIDSLDSDFTNNAGYIVLSLFPLLAIWYDKTLIQFAIAILIVFFTIMSAKRGAMLIAFLCLAFLIFYSIAKNKKNNKFGILIIILIAIVILYQFVLKQFSQNEYLISRLDSTIEGDSSERDILYSFFLDYYFNVYDILHKLIGGGAEHTIEIYDNYAHNDWIEILINNGLLGFVIYLRYWIVLLKTWLHQRQTPLFYEALGLFIIVYFCRTFFSMSYSDISIYSSIMLGYALCQLGNSSKNTLTDPI